jgi:hypothetical protein
MKILKKGRDINTDIFRGTCQRCGQESESVRVELGAMTEHCQHRCENCQEWVNFYIQKESKPAFRSEMEQQVDEELTHLDKYLDNWNHKPQDSLTVKPEATLNVGSSPTLASTELERLEHSIIEISIKGTSAVRFNTVAELQVAALRKSYDELTKASIKLQKLYCELLCAVGQKFPNESRHQTALRYINERENQAHLPAVDEIGLWEQYQMPKEKKKKKKK